MEPVTLKAILDYLQEGGVECKILRTPLKNGLDYQVAGFASVEHSQPLDVSFWIGNVERLTHANGISKSGLAHSQAGLLFAPEIDEELLRGLFPKVSCIVSVKEPYHAMVSFLEHFADDRSEEWAMYTDDGPCIHPSAMVEGFVEDGSYIGPGCVVMKGAVIGPNCKLEANVTIYPNVVVGEGCVFQAGVVVGSRGFGFYEHQGERRKVPHLAGVRIGNRCSFGANTVVAAGFVSPTTIGDDSHFDAMVQIGHNSVVGNNVYMAAQTALGGTTIVADDVNMAGAAKAAGHLTIGKGAVVCAKAGVTKSVPPGKTVSGFPAIDADIWRRQMVMLRMMAKKK